MSTVDVLQTLYSSLLKICEHIHCAHSTHRIHGADRTDRTHRTHCIHRTHRDAYIS